MSGTEEKGPNRIEKGDPTALIAQDIAKVLGGEPRKMKDEPNTHLL